jgi:Bacterial virulence factor lipase N-terminal
MFESRNRLFDVALVAAVAAMTLGGCEATQDGDPFPPPPTETMTAYFNTTTGRLPYPTDLFFAPNADAPVADGTLNLPASIPWRGAAMRNALNSQDGWGTSATLDAGFSLPIDAGTLSGSTVKIVKIWLNPSTKGPANPADPTQAALYLPAGATSPVAAPPLVYGTDYTADISPDVDSGGKVLRITPLKPFDYSRGPTANAGTANANKVLNVGYIVILTNGIHATSGAAAESDTEYAGYKSAPADCSTFTGTPKLICQLTKAQLGIGAAATGTDPASIVLTWGFSTQSMDDTMKMLSLSAAATLTQVWPSGSKTPGGKADIFVGSTVLPYYLKPASSTTDRSILTTFWTAPTGPNPAFGLDPNSRNVTMFNPMPAKQADVTVPMIVSIPDTTASACTSKPANGWPVAIVHHGLGRNRSDAMAIADALADKCIMVAAIDGPVHGITDTANPLYCSPAKPQCFGATERTFNVDLVNASGAATSDGVIDPSGTHAINLSSPATTRDQLRQAAADIMSFAKSVPGMVVAAGTPYPAGPVGIDATRVHYVGDSLGAIVGITGTTYAAGIRSGTYEAPGGVITSILFESPSFKDRIYAGLNAAGLVPDSYVFNLFRRDFQAVVDSGDPVNYVKSAQAKLPFHLIMWPNDTVVPNASTQNLIRAAGLTRLTAIGPNAVVPGAGAYVLFSVGAHGSIFSPTASPAATVEAQTEAVLFADSVNEPGGPFVYLTNASVLNLQ